VPTGTQSNLCGVLSHCQRGDEYIVGQMQHCYRWEGGGAAVFGSVQPQPLNHQADGTLALADIEAAIKPDDPHFARTRLLALENTLGGKVLPFAYLQQATALAKSRGLATHLDGARLFNAAVAQAAPAAATRAARRGASPACSTASRSASARAWARRSARPCAARRTSSRARAASARWRAARCGSPACWPRALRTRSTTTWNGWRRTTRWRAARRGLAGIEGVQVEAPQTNILFVDLTGPGARTVGPDRALAQQGVLATGLYRLRFVTHLDVDAAASTAPSPRSAPSSAPEEAPCRTRSTCSCSSPPGCC
jgi:threonine aldolase